MGDKTDDKYRASYVGLQSLIWERKFNCEEMTPDKIPSRIEKHKNKIKIILIGNSGRGKSTFFNILTGGENSPAGKDDNPITKTVFMASDDVFLIIDTPGCLDNIDQFWHILHMIGEVSFCFLFPIMEGWLSDSSPVSMTIDQFVHNNNNNYLILTRGVPDDPLEKYKVNTCIKIKELNGKLSFDNQNVIKDIVSKIDGQRTIQLLSTDRILKRLRETQALYEAEYARAESLRTYIILLCSSGVSINKCQQTYESVPPNISIMQTSGDSTIFIPESISNWHRVGVCVPAVSAVTGNIAISEANDKAQKDCGVANKVDGQNKVLKVLVELFNDMISKNGVVNKSDIDNMMDELKKMIKNDVVNKAN